MNPDAINWTTVLIAAIAALPACIAAFAAWRKASDTHNLVNSRMTELLALTKDASKSEGALQEIRSPSVPAIAAPVTPAPINPETGNVPALEVKPNKDTKS